MASIRRNGKSWRVETYHKGVRSSRTFKRECDARSWADSVDSTFVGIVGARERLTDHRIVGYLPKKFLNALDKANYSMAEIVMHSMPACSQVGVYFLIRLGEVKYVGKTVNLYHRLDQHRRDGKAFDSYSFIPCTKEQLPELERIYIDLLMPEENKY
jgi:hypothetical protein